VASIEACPFECRAFPAHAAARSLPKVIHRSERRNARKLAHNFGHNAQVDCPDQWNSAAQAPYRGVGGSSPPRPTHVHSNPWPVGCPGLLRRRRRTSAWTSDNLMRGPAKPGSGFVRCVVGSATLKGLNSITSLNPWIAAEGQPPKRFTEPHLHDPAGRHLHHEIVARGVPAG